MRQHRPSCLEGPRSPVLRRRVRLAGRIGGSLFRAARDLRGPFPPAASEVRTELVRRIRRQLAAGTYLTTEKWETALDRLLAGLGGE